MADSCTVLVENLPADASREDLSTYFGAGPEHDTTLV